MGFFSQDEGTWQTFKTVAISRSATAPHFRNYFTYQRLKSFTEQIAQQNFSLVAHWSHFLVGVHFSFLLLLCQADTS